MGYRIKELREQKGLSQEELSERSNVCRATISALENDECKMTTTKTLLKLAEALETSVESLFLCK